MRVLNAAWVVAAVGAVLVACGNDPSVATDCADGETRECYGGPPGTENVGPCRIGLESCSGGRWPGFCVGDIVPRVESCNDFDDDCDAVIDDVATVGDECTATNGCTGARACDAGGTVRCFAPSRNECDLCGGPELSEIGNNCTVDGCEGDFVCTGDLMASMCNAPAPNECGLCGGDAVTGLGVGCMSVDNCTGMTVCDANGETAVCDAPMRNECDLCGGPPVADLGTQCAGTGGCLGVVACDVDDTGSVCDCSANQCLDGGVARAIVVPAVGDLVITELMPSPSGTDSDEEWFEIKVNANVDLNNVIIDRAGDSLAAEPLSAVDCRPVTAGSYIVIAKNTNQTTNGGVPPAVIVDTFGFALVAGSVGTPGDIQLLVGTTLLDAITYTDSTTGKSLQLDPDSLNATANDTFTNFCDAITTYGTAGMGTPGAANDRQCPPPAGFCDTGNGFRAIVPPTAPNLVISELMPNPVTEPTEEWFEITNVGSAPFDLNGLGLDRPDDSPAPNLVTSTACLSVAVGGYAVFARSTTANGGPPVVDATFSFTMIQSSSAVQVVDPTSCSGTPSVCTTIFDSAVWGSSTDGTSLQLLPTLLTTGANDVSTNYCPAIGTYGTAGNLGTPRATNVCM